MKLYMHRAFLLQSIYSQATATTKFSWITTSDSVIRVIFHCSAESSGDLEIFPAIRDASDTIRCEMLFLHALKS